MGSPPPTQPDGFLLVENEKKNLIENFGRVLLQYARALGVADRVTRHSASLIALGRHGDWVRIKARGSCVILGRSDSTLNRSGVRMGTSEFYRLVEAFPEVADSLVVDTGQGGRDE